MADMEVVNGIEWQFTISDGKATVVYATWGPEPTAIPQTTTGAISVPSTLGGCPVTSVGKKAFFNCTGLTTDNVEVKDGKVVISIPVSDKSGFMILQSGDAKVQAHFRATMARQHAVGINLLGCYHDQAEHQVQKNRFAACAKVSRAEAAKALSYT